MFRRPAFALYPQIVLTWLRWICPCAALEWFCAERLTFHSVSNFFAKHEVVDRTSLLHRTVHFVYILLEAQKDGKPYQLTSNDLTRVKITNYHTGKPLSGSFRYSSTDLRVALPPFPHHPRATRPSMKAMRKRKTIQFPPTRPMYCMFPQRRWGTYGSAQAFYIPITS